MVTTMRRSRTAMAQGMSVQHGLFDHMVLQRTSENVSDATFGGMCGSGGALMARILKDGIPVEGFDGVEVGRAISDIFFGEIIGLPAGGPYTIHLWVENSDESLTIEDVLVGDIWLLAGQSNMQGCGLREAAASPDPLVRAYYMDDRWDVAEDPLHNLWAAVDRVHGELMGGQSPAENKTTGVGPGVAFGQEMLRLTGVPQGLIACAHGGTSMAQWDPKLKRKGTRSLYGALARRLRRNGGKVAGMVWYQGESDANPDAVPLYTEYMVELAKAVRRDASNRNLPIAIVQIASVCGWANSAAWNAIQELQRQLPNSIRKLVVVPAIDLELDDLIHVSGKDQQRLGRRLANAITAITMDGTPPITVKKVSVKRHPIHGAADVLVDFDNVDGALTASGRPAGFEIAGQNGANTVYRVELDGSRAILHTWLSPWEAKRASLWYGRGTQPYCNITDEADRSLPVFGPMMIGKPEASTDYVRQLQVSRVMPLNSSVAVLSYPANPKLQSREFDGPFCDLHGELANWSDSRVVYLSCRLECDEPMKLTALLGYDGPVKVWVNGKTAYVDMHGANPATPDAAEIRFKADAGTHEILVALDTNYGKAWGIFLRFLRRDVTQRDVQKGNYVLPKVLG